MSTEAVHSDATKPPSSGTGGGTEAAVRAGARELRARLRRVLVILDDDPTGSQSVYGVPVITAWGAEELEWAFAQGRDAFFVLTNSRSLAPADAAALLTSIVDAVEAAAARSGLEVDFVLRGDSTLRGHFPLESDVLAERAAGRGEPYAALLLVPAYLEAGRTTDGGVHLVRLGERLVPVGETDYARDATFGFRSSTLADWVEEKTGGRVLASAVGSIGRAELDAGPECVRDLILASGSARPIAVDATRYEDLDVVALGTLLAEEAGAHVLVRSGPSFVRSLLGLGPRPPLTVDDVFAGGRRPGHGLIVVGSHVELTGRQLERLRSEHPGIPVVELDVPRLVASAAREPGAVDDVDGAEAEVARCVAEVARALSGSDVLLMTSRKRIDAADAEASLALARAVSRALVEVVARVSRAVPPAWVLAKGGITSSDIATEALGIRRAEVLGQLFPGIVSVWAHRGEDAALAGLPYIVFAGNVGDDRTLADAVTILDGRAGEASRG